MPVAPRSRIAHPTVLRLAAPLLVLLACNDPAEADKHEGVDTARDSAPADSPPADTPPVDTPPLDTTVDTTDTGGSPSPEPGVRLGAIRWDAWQEDGSVNTVVESTLGPAEFHWRMPWFGEETGADSVSIRGNDAALMDAEIAYAHAAGIDYWAFVTYPPDEPMSNALDLYLASAHHDDVGFALLLQGGWLASTADEEWDAQVARYVTLLADPSYVTVLGDRPLVYLFDAASMWGTDRFADRAAAADAFAALGEAAGAAGLGAPYFVLMGWDPAGDADDAATLGFDALSAYAVVGGVDGGSPYTDLDAQARATWDAQAATGREVVPILGAGWDPRPRIVTPTPWATYSSAWFDAPTDEELAAHLQAGLDWVSTNPTSAPAGTAIVYAWNEHDEGGWLCPTWTDAGPDTSRLAAVETALAAHAATVIVPNGGFEAPSVGYGWYVVPDTGVPAELVWRTGASAGAYLLADPIAAHFPAAAEGSQALLLSSAGWVETDVTVPAGDLDVTYALLTGSYPGDTAGALTVGVSHGGVPLATESVSTPTTSGVWEPHTLPIHAAAGPVTLRFEVTAGMPWLDHVGMMVR